jgi:hypothetical protein
MAERIMPEGIEIGQRFGCLIVTGPGEPYISPKGQKQRRVACICDCGKITNPSGYALQKGVTKSCGCKMDLYPPLVSGQRFGRLTVIGPGDPRISPRGVITARVICLCDCGNEVTLAKGHLESGNTKSCGCFKRDKAPSIRRTHGQKHTQIYNIWVMMRQRCYNPKNAMYKWYGARGIYVCDRWLNSFENFLKDMGHKPPGLSLERRDNDGPYSPDNCRWATTYEQAANRRKNVWVEFQGEQMIMSEAIRRSGLPASAVWSRLRDGWTVERALTIPLRKSRKS